MGWPENTNPRSVDPPTNPVHGLPYGPVHGPLLRTPPYGPPQKIAEKKRCRKYKQKWQKDLTYHLNGLTARVGVNSNAYFCRINRLRRKVVLIAYCYLFCCGDVWKTTKDPYALKIKNFICELFLPPPFCWAQPPAFTITNSTQASRKTIRLLSSLVAAMDDR